VGGIEEVANILGTTKGENSPAVEYETFDEDVDLTFGFDEEVLNEYCEPIETSDNEEHENDLSREEKKDEDYNSNQNAEFKIVEDYYM